MLSESDAGPSSPLSLASGLGARIDGSTVELRRPDFVPTADLVDLPSGALIVWCLAVLAMLAHAAAPRVHFVTHSMGGIVLRAWLREEQRKNDGRPPAGLGRVVELVRAGDPR